MKRRTVVTIGASVLACGLATEASHAATYGEMRVLSATSLVQASQSSNSVTLTSDGRYAVHSTAASNLFPDEGRVGETRTTPVLRYDLDAPGSAPELVAYDSSTRPGSLTTGTEPSISANGRWIAFSTGEALIAEDTNLNNDVYVRDMSVPITDASAYTLVSAQSGSATKPLPNRTFGGALVTANSMSGDGTQVAFELKSETTVGATKFAARTTLLRDLTTLETTVVSLDWSGKPLRFDQGRGVPLPTQPALSQDGTTVSWNSAMVWNTGPILGMLPGASYLESSHAQLVWKRVAEAAPAPAPVRLVLTAADPEDPACTTIRLTDSLVPGPCDGPVQTPNDNTASRETPKVMSADGRRVLVAAGNPRTGGPSTSLARDAYLVDMSDGVSRKQGTRRLSFGPDGTSSANVTDVGLSPDGRFAVFTASTLVPGSSPAPLGDFPPPNGPARLYLVDLERDTIELVGRSWTGDDLTGNISKPVVSNDGRRIAFLTDATDLFFGDSNGATDAVVLTRETVTQEQEQLAETAATVASTIPPTRPTAAPTPDYRLIVTAMQRTNGQVLVDVTVPGAGIVTAEARERTTVRSSTAKRTRIARRVAGDSTTRTTGPGKVRLILDPKRTFLKQTRRAGGVPATITVKFRPAAGGATLSKSRSVSFRRVKAATSSARTAR